MLARRAFAPKHLENIDSLAPFACSCGTRGNPEKVCQTDQFTSNKSGGQRDRPTQQQRNVTGCLKEVLLLPAVMIAEKITVVGKETDENILGVWSRSDCIENSPETVVQIGDLAVVTRLDDFSKCLVNCVRPNGVTHEWDFFVEMIFLDFAEDWCWQSIGIVHPVEGNQRSQRRMRPNE